MPRDDWRKARDRSISRAAKREYAADGKSSYPYVWGDDPPREPGDRSAAESTPPASTAARRAVWCVHDNAGTAVAAFEYRDRAGADELAGRLTRETGAKHDVALHKVAMPEAPRSETPAREPKPVLITELPSSPLIETMPPVEMPDASSDVRPSWYHRVWQQIRRFWRSS